MQSSRKAIVTGVTVLLAMGAVLWMRSLASWRPVKIGNVPADRDVLLASDEETALIPNSTSPYTLNIKSGREANWPQTDHGVLDFSTSSSHWGFFLNFDKQDELEVRELQTTQLKRTFRWPKSRFTPQLVFDSNSNNVGVVDRATFRQWNVVSGRMLHNLQLDVRTLPGESTTFALSADGRELVGCANDQGRIWSTNTGRLLRSWKNNLPDYGSPIPIFISADARTVAYSFYSSGEVGGRVVFVDTISGKAKWVAQQNDSSSSLYHRQGDNLVVCDTAGCRVPDVSTGRPLQQLPGLHVRPNYPFPPSLGSHSFIPDRYSSHDILRATPDYIYTENHEGEVFRWRAR